MYLAGVLEVNPNMQKPMMMQTELKAMIGARRRRWSERREVRRTGMIE